MFSSYAKHSTTGYVWRRFPNIDYILVEITSPSIRNGSEVRSIHSFINYLPKIDFRPPQEYLYYLRNQQQDTVVAITELATRRTNEIDNDDFRRQYQYEQKYYDNLFTSYYLKEKYQRVCFYYRLMREFKQKNEEKTLNQKFDF